MSISWGIGEYWGSYLSLGLAYSVYVETVKEYRKEHRERIWMCPICGVGKHNVYYVKDVFDQDILHVHCAECFTKLATIPVTY